MPEAALRDARLDFAALSNTPAMPDARRLAHWQTAALQNRADVRAAAAREQAARAALQLALAQRDGGPPSIAPGFQRDQGANRLTADATLPLPLFNQHQGQIAAARARLALRRAELQQMQAGVLKQLEQAAAGLRTANAAQQEAQTLLRADQALLRGAEHAQQDGWTGPLAVALARLRTLTAGRAVLQARAAQWQALARIENAVQQPLSTAGMAGHDSAIPDLSTHPHTPSSAAEPTAWTHRASAADPAHP